MTRSVPARRGFTLIELIAAIAILAVMGVLILSVISSTSNVASQTAARLDANRVARECLDLIGHDLGGIRTPYARASVTTAVPTGMTNGLQMSVNPATVNAKFRHPHSFFWQTAGSRNTRFGNLAVVGYFVLQDIQSDPKNSRLQLRRLHVEPDDPDATSSDYRIYTNPTDWHPDALLEKFAPGDAATDNANGQRGWVADGVLAMWIRSLDPQGNPITVDAAGGSSSYAFDSRRAYAYTTNGTTVYPAGKHLAGTSLNPRGYDPAAAVPAFLEVGLVCVAPRDVKNIKELPATTATNPTNFHTEIQNFADAVRAQNPQVKSVESFTRKYRLFPAP